MRLQLDCEHARERVSAYMDEALSPADMERTAAHLAECAACARELEDYRYTQAALQMTEVPAPAPEFWAQVHADLRARSTRTPRRPLTLAERLQRALGGFTAPARAFTAGAALATAVIAAVVLTPTPSPVVPAPPDDVDALIVQHAQQSTAHPLSDWSRLTFVSAETRAQTPDDGSDSLE